MSCTDKSTEEVLVATYRGDSVRVGLALGDAGGAPVDASGWSWLAQLRSAAGGLVDQFAVDTSGSATGAVTLSLTPAQTELLVPADYSWDLQATDTEADVRTLVTGRLRVRSDVSRSGP